MKKVKITQQHAWQVSYTTPEGKSGTFRSSDKMLGVHKQLLQGNKCIKSFSVKPLE